MTFVSWQKQNYTLIRRRPLIKLCSHFHFFVKVSVDQPTTIMYPDQATNSLFHFLCAPQAFGQLRCNLIKRRLLSPVEIANSASSFKFRHVKVPQKCNWHCVYEKHILTFSRPVFCGNLAWQNLKGLVELANLTVFWNIIKKKSHYILSTYKLKSHVAKEQILW